MTKMKCTQGPFRVVTEKYGGIRVKAGRYVVATIPSSANAKIPVEERLGNAHMFAASLDLAEALEKIANDHPGCRTSSHEKPDPGKWCKDVARDALAKARRK